jgi:hypothetical protein
VSEQSPISKDVAVKLFSFIDRIFSKEIQEEKEYANSLLEDKNKNIEYINKTMGKEVVKPYKNIKEMADLFEEAAKGKDYSEMKKLNEESKDEPSYMLTLSEYEKLINFRKKYLKEHLTKLMEDINKSQNIIEAQKKTIFRNAGEMNSLRQEAEYYAQYEKLIQFDREFRNQKEQDDHFKNMIKFVADEKTRLSLERSYYKKTYSFDVLMGRVKKSIQENTRMSFRQTIGDILRSSTHITKKGKEYGQVLYEDSGLFKELKRISKLSVKKAKEELLKLENDRKQEINKDNLMNYTIKRELLYFYRRLETSKRDKGIHAKAQRIFSRKIWRV